MKPRWSWTKRTLAVAAATATAAGTAIAVKSDPVLTPGGSGTPAVVKEQVEEDEDALPLRYDAEAVKRYWDRRPLQVFLRSAEVRFKIKLT